MEKTKSMKSFFAIWIAQAFSLLGSELIQFALIWWLTVETGSPVVLALATAMGLLPQVLIGPFAGVLIDRWDRRKVMQIADGSVALVTLVIIFLFKMEMVQPWHVYAVMLLRALGTAFHWPAMQASTTLLVLKKHLPRVAGLNQSLEGLGRILMPPLGALLIAVLPIYKILYIDILTAILAITPLFFIKIPDVTQKADEEKNARVLDELKSGLKFVKSINGLATLVIIGPIFSFLMFPVLSFQPLLVTEHFLLGATELAYIESVYGIGIVAGGLLLSVWGGFKRKIVTGFLALILRGTGLIIVGLAAANQFGMAVVGMALVGFMTPIVTGTLFSTLQASVPPQMQGRVFALMRSGFTSAPLLGLVIAGPLAEVWGVRPWFPLAGVIMVMIGVIGFFLKDVREFEVTSYRVGEDGKAIIVG